MKNVDRTRSGPTTTFLFGGSDANWRHVTGDFDADGKDDFATIYVGGSESTWHWEPNVNGTRGGNQRVFGYGAGGAGAQFTAGEYRK